jgi:flagellar biosynthesis/type III secretory pathway protein FliH
MLEQTGVAPIQKAVKVIREMSEDVKMQEIARMREKALHDEASALNGARREGLAEGEAIGLNKGKAEGRAEGEAIGLNKGLKLAEQGMRAAGISEDEIRRILRREELGIRN